LKGWKGTGSKTPTEGQSEVFTLKSLKPKLPAEESINAAEKLLKESE
jgi:hypothetical protein